MTDKEITADKLVEVLKFTPRTYKIQLWGYGGEKVMGTIDRAQFDYFKKRRLDVSAFAWDSDYAEENKIPEDMQPFNPGSWYECDNMGHAHGVSRNAGTLQIEDENGDSFLELSIEDMSGDPDDGSPEFDCNNEVWISKNGPGSAVFVGQSNEKGTFFEGEINLTAPFDIAKLQLLTEEIDGEEIIYGVQYNGEDIDNWGGSTDGKSSDFTFYLIKDDNTYESYNDADSAEYTMTEWFPKKVKPVRVGVYQTRNSPDEVYFSRSLWTGSRWVYTWTEEADYATAEACKLKEWRGIDHDPDAE